MYNRFEVFGMAFSIALMALALFLVSVETNILSPQLEGNEAAVAKSGIVIVNDSENQTEARAEALISASNGRNAMERLVIEDVTPGTGATVKTGDTISVHYIGRLQNGTEFDNSYNRGTPFTFTVGAGDVIAGWEEGIIGMKEGGTRILVIPPALGYKDRAIGPIPANATLVFSIELLSVE